MKLIATLGVLLVFVNGLMSLGLNVKKWREPNDETPGYRRARKVVTWVFLGILVLASIFGLIAIAVPVMDMIITD